ncbi:MAG TPA: hypothetical protein VGC24_04480, partial [Burkholderiaceae bacterium]
MFHSKKAMLVASLMLATLSQWAAAATSTVPYTLQATDPSIGGYYGSGFPCVFYADDGEGGPGPHYYKTKTFQVSTTGNYDIEDNFEGDNDGGLAILTAPFNPADPAAANCVASVDDDLSGVPLTAGVTYTLVLTSFDPETTGDFLYTFDGPGTIVQTATAPTPIPSLGLMAQI